MCDELNFTNVTQTVWNCFVDYVQSNYGISITNNSGSVSDDGFAFTYSWDGSNNASIQCTSSPWWASCSLLINPTITQIATNCGATSS